MTRHGKNCTAGAVYTYHEKKKDTGNWILGYVRNVLAGSVTCKQ